MQSILVLVVLASVLSCALTLDIALDQRWQLWKQIYNKQYFAVEEHIRYDIWKNDLGVYTYWLEMNKYADMVNFSSHLIL
jgi:hypothetical protein